MKTLIIPLIFSLAASGLAFTASVYAAQDTSVSPQRQKFADCAHKSKGLKGEEHKKFMSDCLSGKTHAMQTAAAGKDMQAEKLKAEPAKARMMTTRDRMKACNAEARGKKLRGGERKAFMKECLKGGGS